MDQTFGVNGANPQQYVQQSEQPEQINELDAKTYSLARKIIEGFGLIVANIFTLGLINLFSAVHAEYEPVFGISWEQIFGGKGNSSPEEPVSDKPFEVLPNLALNQAEKDMKEEIALKISEGYQEVLNLISNHSNNYFNQNLVDNQLHSLALEINTIWINHNLKLLEKSGVSFSKEKIYETLDVFIEHFPLLQKVKDMIVID